MYMAFLHSRQSSKIFIINETMPCHSQMSNEEGQYNVIISKHIRILVNKTKEQNAHGSHIANLREFQSINAFAQSYDYTKTLVKRIQWFIWIIMNYLQTMMFCAKFGWNGPSGSGEKYFLNFVIVFALSFLFLFFSLGKGYGPSFEQTWIPFKQGYNVPRFGSLFWRSEKNDRQTAERRSQTYSSEYMCL